MAGAWSGQRPTLATHSSGDLCSIQLYGCIHKAVACFSHWHDEGWESTNIHVIQRLGEWSLAFPKMKKRDWKGWGCG